MTVPVTGERRDIGRLGGRRAVGRACFAIAAPMPAFVPPASQRRGQLFLDQFFDEAPDPIPDPRFDRVRPSFPEKQRAVVFRPSCYPSSWRNLRRRDNAGPGWLNKPEITPPSNSNHFPDGTNRITARFSPDGALLVSGKLDGTLMLWDVATRQALGPALSGDQAAIASLAFSPDGKTFASINIFGTVVLWDVATRRPPGFTVYRLHRRGEAGSSSVRDGRVLAVIGMDNKVTFWDIATRRPLGQPLSGENGVALSKDFKTVASLGNDGILLRDLSFLADTTRRSWQARACAIANRNLTRAEWRHYLADEPYRATCPGLPVGRGDDRKARSRCSVKHVRSI